MTYRVGRKSRALAYPDRPMTLKDLPATLRRFAVHSRACSARFVSNVTGIEYRRVGAIRMGRSNPTDSEIRHLAALFGVTEQFFRDCLHVLKEWSRVRSSGALPPS